MLIANVERGHNLDTTMAIVHKHISYGLKSLVIRCAQVMHR